VAERVGAVGLEDVEGEAAQAGEHAAAGSDARTIFAHEDQFLILKRRLGIMCSDNDASFWWTLTSASPSSKGCCVDDRKGGAEENATQFSKIDGKAPR
jgi:hypothetical protein